MDVNKICAISNIQRALGIIEGIASCLLDDVELRVCDAVLTIDEELENLK